MMERPNEAAYPLALDAAARARESTARPLTLDADGLADLEALLIGQYAPLRNYCDRRDDEAVAGHGNLANGAPATTAILLRVDAATCPGETLALRDPQGVIYALCEVNDVFDAHHVGRAAHGRLMPVRLPSHPDHARSRRLPHELAATHTGLRTIAWFCDDLLLATEERSIAELLARGFDHLLLLVPAPFTSSGDLRLALRVRLAHAARQAIGAANVSVNVVTLAGDPSDVTRRAWCARACGASAVACADADQVGLYERFGLAAVAVRNDSRELERTLLARGHALPQQAVRDRERAWLDRAYPPRARQGVTLWLTGLSQSGKSTIAALVAARLVEYGRASTLLDGDIVRTHLSKGLGFSREDRDLNIRRIGFVAAEITRHGGLVIVAAIAPYRAVREENRRRIGNYVEIFVNAPVDVCASRDQKGQYEKARRGEIKGFTGVDDPYEPPESDFVECRTDRETVSESAERIVRHLIELGYLESDATAS